MAGGALGKLTVQLALDIAEFVDGVTKAEREAAKLRAQAENLGAKIGLAVAGGVTAAVTALAMMTKAGIDAADQLDNMAQRTGESAEKLSALQYAAKMSDATNEQLSSGLKNLAKSISDAANGTGKGADALAAMGIAATNSDGSLRKTSEVLGDMADKFSGWADGPEKTALAMATLRGAGEALIPMLNSGRDGLDEMAQEAERLGLIISTKTASEAAAFNDNLDKLHMGSAGFARMLAAELLPALQGISAMLLESKSNSELAASAARAIGDVFEWLVRKAIGVVDVMQAIGEALGGFAARVGILQDLYAGIVKGDGITKSWTTAMAQFGAVSEASIDRAKQRAIDYNNTLAKIGVAPSAKPKDDDRQKTAAPRMAAKVGGGPDDSARLLRKQLDDQVKAVREFAEQQKAGYDFAQRYLDGAYRDGLTSLSAYFEAQTSIRDAGLSATISGYDREIAALQDYRSNVSKASERQATDTKIAELQAKREQAIQKAGQQAILSAQDEARAIRDLQSRYQDLQDTIAGLSGNDGAAAATKISRQVADARKLLTQGGIDTGIADDLQRRLTQTEALKQLQREYSEAAQQAAAVEQERSQTAAAAGMSELETMQLVGQARQAALAPMSEMVEKAKQLAAELGTPEAKAFADNLSNSFVAAAAAADPLLEKIRGIGEQMSAAMVQPLEDFVVKGGSAKDLLRDMEKQLLKIMTNQLMTKPLEGFLSNLLGGAAGGAGSAGGGGGWIGSLVSMAGSLFGGGRAAGGPVEAGRLYRVNEHGPELLDVGGEQYLMMGSQRGRVHARDSGRSDARGDGATGRPIVVQVAGQRGLTRATAMQQGQTIGAGIQRALARNG